MVKGKYANFIQSNIRHSRRQIIVVAILLIVAAALMNMCLFLSFKYNGSFAAEKERLVGEDMDFLFVEGDPRIHHDDQIREILADIPEVKSFEVDSVVANNGTVEFKDRKLTHNLTYMNFSKAMEKKIGQYEILENNGQNGVFLSYLFSVDAGYAVGDTIRITMDQKTHTFPIVGFYNNIDTGTINCTDFVFLLTDDYYKEVTEHGENAYRISAISGNLETADRLESTVSQQIRKGVPTLVPLRSSNAIRLASSRYVTSSVLQAIISVTSIMMIAVLLVIVVITLTNYIRDNMKNLGALKALGYLSRDLIIPIVAEFSILALVMSGVGVAASYAILPILNSALERQVGIPYNLQFMLPQAILSMLVCVVAVLLTSWISVLRIKRITPIMAIRDSAAKKKSGKVFFALDKTRFGLNTAISLKNWMASKTRNIVVFLSITGVSFLLGFSCFVYQNVVVDSSSFMSLVYGSTTDSLVNVSPMQEEALKTYLQENEDVQRFYLYNTGNVIPEGLPKLYAYVFDQPSDLNEEKLCVEGCLPRSTNEITVNGAYARKHDIHVGDTVRFEREGTFLVYHVCGLSQGAAASGNDCYLTREGYSEIQALTSLTYYIDLKEGVDIAAFNREIDSKVSLLYYSNFKEASETASKSYKDILSLATVMVVLVSLIITGFILYILVSLQLVHMRRDHGILKSLGFVTKDIIYQTVVSILPTCLLAVVAGLWLSRKGAAAFLILALRSLGIFTFGEPTQVIYLLIAGIGISLFTAIYSVILSGSVRFITPHQLFNEE